ncbi:MAG: hypothetical protein OXC39_06765, partial [Candidatus Dadabacteria bacterium]|nr:hypothetical protein [Candidatus Dadabacteria bacterium]
YLLFFSTLSSANSENSFLCPPKESSPPFWRKNRTSGQMSVSHLNDETPVRPKHVAASQKFSSIAHPAANDAVLKDRLLRLAN